MALCFVANFYKTFLFHEVAQKLTGHGVAVSWIVTKEEQFLFLKQHYPEDRILYLNRSYMGKTQAPVDDLRIHELVYGDRVFKYDLEGGIRFLTNIQRPVYDFIARHKIEFVIGEPTWAHELLIRRLARKRRELNCMYLDCSLIRIPNQRFSFFTGEGQYGMLEFEQPVTVTETIRVEKPAYLKLNDKIVRKNSSLKGRLNRLKRFITGENIEKNDPNVIVDTARRFRVAFMEEYNKVTYKRIRTVPFEQVRGENYVFIGFHKQPESSIDVNGRYYEDQAMNILNIWRMLPPGWKILLKEHTNAIGDRSYQYYKNLLRYPNVLMVEESTDSKELISHSRLVVSVTGTISYEAALMNIPAITFGKVYFNRINACKYVSLDALVRYETLTDLVDEIRSAPDNRLEYSHYILKNSFEGYISDYMTDPSVMDAGNIDKLCKAFLSLIHTYGGKDKSLYTVSG
jgi:hypothetical protein